ncbi:MAG: RNA 2',3'-cyclic phosphodiesterase [Pseudomonadota bacterium]
MTTRTFVAFSVPDAVRPHLERLQTGVRGARWVDPENFHLTLAFIGDADTRQLADYDAALSDITAPSFELTLDGAGVFGRRRPHALWAGVRANPDLDSLQEKVETALRRAGADIEARKFTSHVTLAYLKGASVDETERWRSGAALFQSAPIAVGEFHLYASYLGSAGARYEILRDYALATN